MGDDGERYSVGDWIKGTFKFIFISQRRYDEISDSIPCQEGHGDIWLACLEEAQAKRLERKQQRDAFWKSL